MAEINVELTLNDNAYVPTKGTSGSAGYDVYAAADGVIEPGCRSGLIPTGLTMKIPAGYYCNIEPRSGLAHKYGISVLGGIIDSDYKNEVFVILHCNGNTPFNYVRGDRIAQFIFKQCADVSFKSVSALSEDDNADRFGGFGSTGL